MALALWRGKAADRMVTKVEVATEAVTATAATEAVAEAAAAQQQRSSSVMAVVAATAVAASTEEAAITKGVGARERAGKTEGAVAIAAAWQLTCTYCSLPTTHVFFY